MSIETLMNKKVDIETPTRTKDKYGTSTETTANRYTNLPCRIQPWKGEELFLANSERTVVTHKMFVPPQFTGINAQDRVKDGTKYYDIIVVRDIDFMGHHFEIALREVTVGF